MSCPAQHFAFSSLRSFKDVGTRYNLILVRILKHEVLIILFFVASLAITIGIVMWLVTYYAVVIPIEQKYQTLSMFHKLISSVLPNVSLYMAVKVMSAFEGKGILYTEVRYSD